MSAIVVVVYQLISTPSPPSSLCWRWMHFHREHGCSSNCLTITRLHNGAHPILDVCHHHMSLIKVTLQINGIHYPVICGDTAGCSRTFLNGREPTDPPGCLKMFDGLKYHPDAVQNTSTLLATSANTAEPKEHVLRWWESCEVEPEPTHYTALNAGVFDLHR